MWSTSASDRRRRHSFDDFISVEKLDRAVKVRKCKSLLGNRWEDEEKVWNCECDSSDSEQSSVASFDSSAVGHRTGADHALEKDLQTIKPCKLEKYEKPGTAPEDLNCFQEFHNWVPSRYQDSVLLASSYARPTPSYIWKARRRKYTKAKYFEEKRFEVLEIESDIDTEDDDFEEKTKFGLNSLPHCHSAKETHVAKVEWLRKQLTPLRNRRCSSDEYSVSSDSEPDVPDSSRPALSKQAKSNEHGDSSEDDICNVDQDSDYEYMHIWGESDSGHSDLELGTNFDRNSCGLLANSPKRQEEKSGPLQRYFQLYDAPSPEPFLPEPQLETKTIPTCEHGLNNGDTLALNLLELDLSAQHSEMPRVSSHAPNFKNEENITRKIVQFGNFDNLFLRKTAVVKRRHCSDNENSQCNAAGGATVSKFARLDEQDTSSSDDNSLVSPELNASTLPYPEFNVDQGNLSRGVDQ